MRVVRRDQAGADVVTVRGERRERRLRGHVPELCGGVIRAGENLGGRERGEARDVNRLLVRVKGTKDGAGIDVEYLCEGLGRQG